MLKVGQHVVLVRDDWKHSMLLAVKRFGWTLPVKGKVYTIREYLYAEKIPHVTLVEIINPPTLTGKDISFYASRFRPLRPLRCEDFTAGLTPVDELDLLREYQGA